jgi:hypothetical protein
MRLGCLEPAELARRNDCGQPPAPPKGNLALPAAWVVLCASREDGASLRRTLIGRSDQTLSQAFTRRRRRITFPSETVIDSRPSDPPRSEGIRRPPALSRRRSRVRVSSLPSLEVPGFSIGKPVGVGLLAHRARSAAGATIRVRRRCAREPAAVSSHRPLPSAYARPNLPGRRTRRSRSPGRRGRHRRRPSAPRATPSRRP